LNQYKKQDSCRRLLDRVREDSGLYKHEVARKIVQLVPPKLKLAAKTRRGILDLDAALVVAASKTTQ